MGQPNPLRALKYEQGFCCNVKGLDPWSLGPDPFGWIQSGLLYDWPICNPYKWFRELGPSFSYFQWLPFIMIWINLMSWIYPSHILSIANQTETSLIFWESQNERAKKSRMILLSRSTVPPTFYGEKGQGEEWFVGKWKGKCSSWA